MNISPLGISIDRSPDRENEVKKKGFVFIRKYLMMP